MTVVHIVVATFQVISAICWQPGSEVSGSVYSAYGSHMTVGPLPFNMSDVLVYRGSN